MKTSNIIYSKDEWLFLKDTAFNSAIELITVLIKTPDAMGIEEAIYPLQEFLNENLISSDDLYNIFGEYDEECLKRLLMYFSNGDLMNWNMDDVKNTLVAYISFFNEPKYGSVISLPNNWMVDDLFIDADPIQRCSKLGTNPSYSPLYSISTFPTILFQQSSAVGSGGINNKEKLKEVREALNEKRKKRNKYRAALGFEAIFLPFLSHLKKILESSDEVAKKALRKSLEKAGFKKEFIEQLEENPNQLRKLLRLPGNFKRLTGFLLKKVHWLGPLLAAADLAAAITTLTCLHALEDEIVTLESQESILVAATVGKADPGKRYKYLPYVEPLKLGIKPGQNCSYKVNYYFDWVDDTEKNLHSDKISGPHDMQVNPENGARNVPTGAMVNKDIITIPTIPNNMLYGTIIAEVSVSCGDKIYPTKRIYLATVRPK